MGREADSSSALGVGRAERGEGVCGRKAYCINNRCVCQLLSFIGDGSLERSHIADDVGTFRSPRNCGVEVVP